ncbi:hypothetical protein [Neobacillus notoginsengisoli]
MNLRILTLDDAEDVFNHFADSEITRFMDIEPRKIRRKLKKSLHTI